MKRFLNLKLGAAVLLGIAAVATPAASVFAADQPTGKKPSAHNRKSESAAFRAFLWALGIEPFGPAEDFDPVFPPPPEMPAVPKDATWSLDSTSSWSTSTSVSRTDDRFVVKHRQNDLTMTVSGTVVDGKGQLTDVVYREGRAEEKKATALADVPEKHRATVEKLLRQGAKP